MQTILLVDDDPGILVAWTRLLRLHYCVATASDGESGLAAAKKVQPVLIVTDWAMPGMDGVEFCRHLKRDPQFAGIPVVLTSADDVATLRAPVWDEYWQKPVPIEDMLASIKRLLPL